MPGGSLTAPEVTACSAEPIAADMVCEPASMPPAAPGGRSNSLAPTTHERQAQSTHDTTARKVNFSPSPFRLLMKDGPTRKPDAVHEEIVEQALGEVVQLELGAVERGPDRKRRSRRRWRRRPCPGRSP